MSNEFKNFNEIFIYLMNKYKGKTLYMIARYDMNEMIGLTGIVSDDYDEIKQVYDDKYTWKENEIGITEYHYEILKINMELIK